MSLRDRQIREMLDENLKAYREVFVRELKQARLFNESYAPPSRFERGVAFQISKYFIAFQSAIDDIINSHQPDVGYEPIRDGSALVKIYSELVAYIDSYQRQQPLGQRDIAIIEEKFDALLPSLSQVTNLAQEEAWRDSGIIEEIYTLIEDRVYLPLKEALTRLPAHKKMLVQRQGFSVAEDRLRLKQQKAFEQNQAIARGADMRQQFREHPPEYQQFPYVPADSDEEEEAAQAPLKARVKVPVSPAKPKGKTGPKGAAYYKRFRSVIEKEARRNGVEDQLGDRDEFERTKKIGTLRKLLAIASKSKQSSAEFKILLDEIETGRAASLPPPPAEAEAEAEAPFEAPVPKDEVGFGAGTPQCGSWARKPQHISFTITEKEQRGKGYSGGRFSSRLVGGFGETEGQMGGLPLGMRKALTLRPSDRRPVKYSNGSLGQPEQDLSIEDRMQFLNQLESHKVRDEDDDRDFNSISNLRKMMEKRIKKHK